MIYIEPIFKIDEFGYVVCKSHSNYSHHIHNKKSILNRYQAWRLSTCKTCSYYSNDRCFFSKAEISEILSDMKGWNNIFRTKYKCEFCGTRIEKRFSVFHKLYFERKENIEIPLLCCHCYIALKTQWIDSSFRLRTWGYILVLICGILGLIPPLAVIFTTKFINPFLHIIFLSASIIIFIIIFIMIVNFIKRLVRLNQGKRSIRVYSTE